MDIIRTDNRAEETWAADMDIILIDKTAELLTVQPSGNPHHPEQIEEWAEAIHKIILLKVHLQAARIIQTEEIILQIPITTQAAVFINQTAQIRIIDHLMEVIV